MITQDQYEAIQKIHDEAGLVAILDGFDYKVLYIQYICCVQDKAHIQIRTDASAGKNQFCLIRDARDLAKFKTRSGEPIQL